MKAYLIDDGKVLSGILCGHKFIPDDKNCGFSYQVIAQSDLGFNIFFEEDIAKLMAIEYSPNIKTYDIILKGCKGSKDFKTRMSTSCPNSTMRTCVHNAMDLYQILDECDTQNLYEFFRDNRIVQFSHKKYVKVIKFQEV